MAEADILRRAMSGKYRGHAVFFDVKEKFFNNCQAFGYDAGITQEVWRQIESFGGYSFSKAHSASFAVESYQSLFLKTYFPMEFMVSVINNFGGFYSTELYFHELKRTGAQVHAPCINESKQLTHLYGKDVYVGFVHIQNLEEQLIYRILEERHRHGSYLHLQDFIERVQPPLEQLNILIRCGALRFTGKNKKTLLWEANFLQKKNKQHVPAHHSIFDEKPMDFVLPELHQHPLDDALDELEILGFPLGDVFRLLDDPAPRRYIKAQDLAQLQGQEVEMMGYLVTSKFARTLKGDNMFFGTFLDATGDWLDTVHFPDSARTYPLLGRGFYRFRGVVMEEFGVYSVNVTHMEKIGLKGRRD
jgi:DNA polymerase-3 subunit alpha